MRTTIAETDKGGRMIEHLEDVVLIRVGVVEHRNEEHRSAVTLQHQVVEKFERGDTESSGSGCE
ncbi:unannotated protein [freshwater metagenome]|uniref:Unannotated protein n=1 Tax=freshwater metagenome TaxID=449393 RepID=A0A6J6P8T9_9ZZZZ